jgi:1,4-alpha-glucan branching enzyme
MARSGSEKGYLSLLLHAHLPFVRHPEYADFLEERWFFEALVDTYLPLLEILKGWENDNIEYALTLNISPSLCNMLNDNHLKDKFIAHINKMIELCAKEIERTHFMPEFNALARMYFDRYSRYKDMFLNHYQGNLINAFKHFQDHGNLEIITCAATHGFLPLMNSNENATKAQIRTGVNSYRKFFNRDPLGIWLPECAFSDGIDKFLSDENIRYFVTETHGVLFGEPRPKYGVYSTYYTKNGVAIIARDIESSKSVWSSKEGYPGDYNYREYYRDLGFDLDYDYIKPYISSCGTRVFTGIKYYKITGPSPHKEPYNLNNALNTAASHAANFMFNREKQIEHLSNYMDRKPIVFAPYDAELYGHWWFEGMYWLNFLVRKIMYDQNTIKMTTPFNYLKKYPRNQVIEPAASTWGWKGYNEVWLCGDNDWIYKHLNKIADLMTEATQRHPHATGIKKRILNQMGREVMLAQSSDWAFIMKTGTFTEYAKKRTIAHINRFFQLLKQLESQFPNNELLESIESKDNIFPELDYAVYK